MLSSFPALTSVCINIQMDLRKLEVKCAEDEVIMKDHVYFGIVQEDSASSSGTEELGKNLEPNEESDPEEEEDAHKSDDIKKLEEKYGVSKDKST